MTISLGLGVWWMVGRGQEPQVPTATAVALPEAQFLRAASSSPPTDRSLASAAEKASGPSSDTSPPAELLLRLQGTVVRSDGTPVVGANVTAQPLWGLGYRGDLERLRAAVRRTTTDARGAFRLDLSRATYFDPFLVLSVANADQSRTWIHGQYSVPGHHVLVVPDDEAWDVDGNLWSSDGSLEPLRVILMGSSDHDVGNYGSRLTLLADATTQPDTGRLCLTGVVDPLQSVAGPVIAFVTTPSNQPIARLGYGSVQQFASALKGGIVLGARRIDLQLPLPPGFHDAEVYRIRFPERSIFLPTPGWRDMLPGGGVSEILADGPFEIAVRSRDRDETLHGLLGADGAIEWKWKSPAAHSLSVRLEADGHPVANTYVTCCGTGSEAIAGPPVEAVITDHDGKALFAVAAGDYRVSVADPARGVACYDRPSVDVRVPGPEVVLSLNPAASISLGLLYDPPRPTSGVARVLLAPIGSRSWQSRTLGYPVGSNVLDGVRPGRYRVLAFADGYEGDAIMEVPTAEAARVTLPMYQVSRIAGNVVSNGVPLSGLLVRLVAPEPQLPPVPWRQCVTGTRGEFEVWAATTGAFVEVEHADGAITRHVAVGGDSVVEVGP